MKDYHKILGVTPDASEEEIRKAYRRLAMKYHPDRNPTSTAADTFQEIKDAYEILLNKKPGAENWNEIFGGTYQETPVVDPREEYRREYRKRRRAEDQQKHQSMMQFMQKLVRFGWIPLAVLGFIFTDYLLPPHKINDEILEVDFYQIKRSNIIRATIYTRYTTLTMYDFKGVEPFAGARISYTVSPILRKTYSPVVSESFSMHVWSPLILPYKIFYSIMLLCGTLSLIKSVNLDIRFSGLVVSVFLSIIVAFLIL